MAETEAEVADEDPATEADADDVLLPAPVEANAAVDAAVDAVLLVFVFFAFSFFLPAALICDRFIAGVTALAGAQHGPEDG